MVGSLENDLQILTKLLEVVIASCPEDAHKIEQQADSAVAMLIQRLLAGRLYEGWKLFQAFSGRFREAYEDDLDLEAKKAARSLRKYFGSSKSLLAQVRNKIGFHSDAPIAQASFAQISDAEDLGSYICQTVGNTLHLTPEIIHYETVCSITGEPDFINAINLLWRDTRNQVSDFNTVLNAFTVLFARRYLPDALANLAGEYDDIHAEPLSSLKFQFFSDLTECKKAE